MRVDLHDSRALAHRLLGDAGSLRHEDTAATVVDVLSAELLPRRSESSTAIGGSCGRNSTSIPPRRCMRCSRRPGPSRCGDGKYGMVRECQVPVAAYSWSELGLRPGPVPRAS